MLHINFNSWNLSCCGGNRFLFNLSNRLVDRGHKVTITHVGLPSYSSWFKPIKAEIIECGYGLSERMCLKAFNRPSRLEMLKRLEQNIPDCDVNVATFCFTAYPTVLSGKGEGYYLVQHYEPGFFQDEKTKQFAASTYNLPLKCLCVSNWLTELVGGYNIGNGVDLNVFHPLTSKPKHKKPKVLILKVKEQFKRPQLLDGVAKLLDDCQIVRPVNVSDAELVKLYRESDVFVGASEREGFYYPALEAMACGTPVVCSPCAEYLDEGNCVLVRENRADMFVFRVRQLLGDKTVYNGLVEAGFRTVAGFSFDCVVDRFLSAVNGDSVTAKLRTKTEQT